MSARVVITWNRELVPHAQNVLYFEGPASPAIGALQDLADAISVHHGASALRANWLSNTWTVNRIEAFDYEDSLRSAANTGTWSGQGGLDALPSYCTLAVRHQTGTGWRNGRTFIPGYSETASGNSGRPVAAAVTDTVAWFNVMRNTVDALSPSWRFAVRQADGALPWVSFTDRSLSSSTLGWQNQRRRRRALR